jgi:hypothetical protein
MHVMADLRRTGSGHRSVPGRYQNLNGFNVNRLDATFMLSSVGRMADMDHILRSYAGLLSSLRKSRFRQVIDCARARPCPTGSPHRRALARAPPLCCG